MSSGAYGTVNLGLRHQDVYSVILSEMPRPGRAGPARRQPCLVDGQRPRASGRLPL